MFDKLVLLRMHEMHARACEVVIAHVILGMRVV